jgi:hypothetical protein
MRDGEALIRASESFAPTHRDYKNHSARGCGDCAAIGPLDLSGHEATWEDVDSLKNPDNSNCYQKGGEYTNRNIHNVSLEIQSRSLSCYLIRW